MYKKYKSAKPLHYNRQTIYGTQHHKRVPHHTQGGRSGKVVASHVEDAGSSLVEAAPIYMYCVQVALGGYCPVKGGG